MALSSRLRDLFAPVYNVTFEYTPATVIAAGMSTARLYETQPNLRAVVSFLADSIAQLPVRTYHRVDEANRQPATGSPLALLLENPNPDQTSYEFMAGTMTEYLLFGEVVWWILPADSPSGYELRIVPQAWISERKGSTAYAPDTLILRTKSGGSTEVHRDEFVHFRMYEPGKPGGSCSPVESLKMVLAEQVEAERFRRDIWKSSGRFNSYLSRPAGVEWSDDERKRFTTAFREAWGSRGENAGKIPLLEDGMKIEAAQFNSKEAQWVESVQLTRQECAAAYHLNPSVIWHDSTQTYASARDNARALYSDTLGSKIRMMEQKVSHDLAPKVHADSDIYVELDLSEKLRGSFEEQASVLQSAIGAPYMTRDEGRARMNLPPIEGGDELVTPLNVITGGLASPNDTDPTVERYNAGEIELKASEPVRIKGKAEEREQERLRKAFERFFKRCGDTTLKRISAGAEWWDADRWTEELSDDIRPIFFDIADRHGEVAAARMATEYVTKLTGGYLNSYSHGIAESVVTSTKRKLDDAIGSDDESKTPAHVFEVEEDSGSKRLGASLATAVAGWAVLEACRQAQAQGKQGMTKTWIHVPSENPRPDHEAMDGETVPYDEPFSNGMQWPGDSAFDAADIANCNCQIEVTVP